MKGRPKKAADQDPIEEINRLTAEHVRASRAHELEIGAIDDDAEAFARSVRHHVENQRRMMQIRAVATRALV